jgi:hypothetical protein
MLGMHSPPSHLMLQNCKKIVNKIYKCFGTTPLDLQNLIEVGNGFFISGAAQDLPTEPWDKLQPKLYEFIWCKSASIRHLKKVSQIVLLSQT